MWKCSGCGETVEDTFDVCWNCQRDKAGEPSSAEAPQVEKALVEATQADGSVSVTVYGRELTCAVCGNKTFHERDSLLNTRLATFFRLDWANAQAVNYICMRCGYIFWFWAE